MKVLFTGDSITDMGRVREWGLGGFGQGYPVLLTAKLRVKYPGKAEFINTGISGNRVVDLYARVKNDMWHEKPDVLSILIGINDVWHEYGDYPNGVEADRFEKVLRMLVEDTLNRLPGIKIVLMEPFTLKGSGNAEYYDEFRKETELRADAVKRIAEEFNLIFVPLQKMFDDACNICEASYWLSDGVHPTPAGHQLIADKWCEVAEDKIF